MIRHVDSFSHYNIGQMGRKYDYLGLGGGGISSLSTGRGMVNIVSGSGSVGIGRVLDAQSTWGAAMQCSTNSGPWTVTSPFICFMDGGTPQITIGCDGSGHPTVWRGSGGGTQLGTSSVVLPGSQLWFHVEAKVLIHATAGTVDVWVNSVNVIHLTGQNTKATSNATASAFRIGGDTASVANTIRVADLIVYDGQTGVTGPVGDCSVQGRLPTGAGNYTEFTTLVGSTQWQAVSENPADDDTSYIGSATAGQRSTFATADLTAATGTVAAVVVNYVARKDDAGARSVAGMARSAGADAAGPGNSLGASYQNYQEIMEADPSSAAWTISSFNGAEFGVKEIS